MPTGQLFMQLIVSYVCLSRSYSVWNLPGVITEEDQGGWGDNGGGP